MSAWYKYSSNSCKRRQMSCPFLTFQLLFPQSDVQYYSFPIGGGLPSLYSREFWICSVHENVKNSSLYHHNCHYSLSLWTHGMLLKVLSSVSDLLYSKENLQSQETIYKMGKKDFQTI